MNERQFAVAKKDFRGITSNKQVLAVMLIVPLALTVVLPTILILTTYFSPESASDFQKLIDMLPISAGGDTRQMIIYLVINKIMPAFFMIIPIMASSVMAASSFVGEKEKQTLETLLYSPLYLKQLFVAKIFAAFAVGISVTYISFAAMLAILQAEVFIITGSLVAVEISWAVVLLLVSPSVSLIAIALTVRGSAKAQTVEQAQQSAVFLIFPIIALVISQLAGIMILNTGILLALGAVLAALCAVLIKSSAKNFTYEKLLG